MYTIYHNPRCRKSRETLQILNENGVSEEEGNLEVVLYLENPPTAEQLGEIASLLNMHPIEFTRTKESQFKELSVHGGHTPAAEEMIAHMVTHPILIERPIVLRKDASGHPQEAVIGRPPENVGSILD